MTNEELKDNKPEAAKPVLYLPLLKEKTDIEKCFWKGVAENNARTRAEGNECVSLGEKSECYKCAGYKTECRGYATMSMI